VTTSTEKKKKKDERNINTGTFLQVNLGFNVLKLEQTSTCTNFECYDSGQDQYPWQSFHFA